MIPVLVWVLIALVSAAGSLWGHKESLERGNGLFRQSRLTEAERVYRGIVESESPPDRAVLNLGIVILSQERGEAEEYLRAAAQSPDPVVAQRAHYALGRSLLGRAREIPSTDSAIRLLDSAAASNRRALRLDPSDADARWNLFVAEWLRDSMVVSVEEVDLVEEQDDNRSSEGNDGFVTPRIGGEARPGEGEREALAGTDPGPLDRDHALDLVEEPSDDIEALIRGILWSHRPDVRPWAEPYPGGNW